MSKGSTLTSVECGLEVGIAWGIWLKATVSAVSNSITFSIKSLTIARKFHFKLVINGAVDGG